MSLIAEKNATLKEDASFETPLQRVAYEAGMMLGLEATRDEQQYHRQRLSRQQYWLHGAGTLTGMVVSVESQVLPDSSMATLVKVSPGIGIDGLGRELLVHETHCVNLKDWIAVQNETTLRDGYKEADSELWLKVSARYRDCSVAAQPVLARKLNLSTDAVQPSRTADSVQLDMDCELPPAAPSGKYKPWWMHAAVDDNLPAELNPDEVAEVDGLSGEAKSQLNLHARMLFALGNNGVSVQSAYNDIEDNTKILLARIKIPNVTDLNNIALDAAQIRPNNLVRPFILTASQLAYISRQS